MPSGKRQRPAAPQNPLVIQPSEWSRAEHILSWLHPGLRRFACWRDRFYTLAQQLDMSVTESVSEAEQVNVGLFEQASVIYTASKTGIRVTMQVVVDRQWRAKNTFIVATVAWGASAIPVEPEETEGPFVLPLYPLINSQRFQASGAPRWVEQISPSLGPLLDTEWLSLGTTLYHSEEFTLVRQTFGIWTGKRAPLVARFLKGGIELSAVKEKVETIGLPQRVRLKQIPPWWFQATFQRKLLAYGLAFLVLLQLGIVIYAIIR